MPSSDITTCASLHCPKRWRCAEHYLNVPVDAVNLAEHTIGWAGGVKRDGAELPYTPDNAVNLYNELPFVARAVNNFIYCQMYGSHFDPYMPELGGCDNFREVEVGK